MMPRCLWKRVLPPVLAEGMSQRLDSRSSSASSSIGSSNGTLAPSRRQESLVIDCAKRSMPNSSV